MAVKLLDFGNECRTRLYRPHPWSTPPVGGVYHRPHDGCADINRAVATAHWATRRIETKKVAPYILG